MGMTVFEANIKVIEKFMTNISYGESVTYVCDGTNL